jgi:chemotaxis protein MotA
MDLTTIGGLVIGALIIGLVMILDGGSPLELFAVPQAIFLIVGGSIAATAITVPMEILVKLPKYLSIAAKNSHYDIAGTIDLLIKMTDRARREGLLALEDDAKKVTDPFMQRAIMMVVDGVDSAQVRTIMETTIENMQERHKQGYSFFITAGGFAPTFGIIGTVMGLISVLKELDNPSKLAKSIASAFLATLWGLIMANLVYLPLGNKLKCKDEEEAQFRTLIMEGVLSMQAGENPRILKEKLNAFLAPNHGSGKKEKEKADAAPSSQAAPQKA